MRSLVAGGAGLDGQHRSAPGQRFQAGGSENVGRPIRQRGFPDEEVRPRGLMSEGKRSRQNSAPLTFVGWCRGVRGQSASCPRLHRRPVHPRQGMNPRLLRRALPKAWAALGRIHWPGEPHPEKRPRSGSPGSGPPTPRSPRHSSACARQALPNITHDGSASIPESRPALQPEDVRAHAGQQLA